MLVHRWFTAHASCLLGWLAICSRHAPALDSHLLSELFSILSDLFSIGQPHEPADAYRHHRPGPAPLTGGRAPLTGGRAPCRSIGTVQDRMRKVEESRDLRERAKKLEEVCTRHRIEKRIVRKFQNHPGFQTRN